MNVLALALNTFREAVRDKFLYLLVALALVLIAASRAIGWVSYGGEQKIPTDLGLFAVWLFSALVSIFIGTGMIHKEIEKRTLYTILSKPIHRWEFVLGKYFGLLLTTLVCWIVLSAALLGYLKLMSAPLSWAILQALSLTFVEMVVVTALALFFSSISTPLLSAVFTFLLVSVGQLTKWIVDLGYLQQQRYPLLEPLMKGIYLVLPNLHNFNVRQEAVLAAGQAAQTAIPMGEMYAVVTYGIAYSAAVRLAAILMFRRRNF